MSVLIVLLIGAILLPLISLSQKRHFTIAEATCCQPVKLVLGGFLGLSSFCDLVAAWKKSQVLDYFEKLHDNHGSTFEMKILPQLRLPVIFTISPPNIDALLASQFMDFGLGVHRQGPFDPFSGKGIFTSDGAEWSYTRRLLRPQFLKARVSDFGRFIVHVERFLDDLPKDGREFDVQNSLFQLFSESSMEFLLGDSGNQGIFPLLKDKQEFFKAFDYSQELSVLRLFASPFHFLINPAKFQRANQVIRGFMDHCIEEALDGTKYGHSGKVDVEKYMFLEALAEDTKDRKVLRGNMLNVLFAARDDPASLLSSIFYLLARDRRVWEKLRVAVVQCFGNECEKEDIDAQKINEDLPYLRYVINEGLRLFPPVPTNARMALRDTTLPSGGGLQGDSLISVRKGQIVAYNIYALHRRKEIWGPDADEFLPERWETFTPKPFEFAPFSGGPRVCIGQQQALLQVSYVLIKVLLRFNRLERGSSSELHQGTKPDIVAKLSIAHKGGVLVRLVTA